MKPDTDQPPMSKSVVKRLQAQGAEPVATLPARFHLSGHCDNAAHSACPNPDKCTCECHVSAPEAGGEPVYDAETDAAFDEFLRSDPSAQEAMRQQWAKRTKKSMNDQSGPKTCERIYADMETGDWFPERVGERPMNLVEYTRASQPLPTTEPRHAFERYKKTDYCGASLAKYARCGRREHDPIHLSDDIVDDRRVPFSLPTTEARERARYEAANVVHHIQVETGQLRQPLWEEIAIASIAAALSSTPSELSLEQVVASIKDSVEHEYNDLKGYRSRLGAALMDLDVLLNSRMPTPTDEVNRRARAAAEESIKHLTPTRLDRAQLWLDGDFQLTAGKDVVDAIEEIIMSRFTTDVEGENQKLER